MSIKTALISDFDGTLTPEDFFWYVSERWLDAEALEPWQRYLDGKLSHLEALNLIFSRIREPAAAFDAFIKEIPFDPAFVKTAALCREKNIPFYICSAGCDYYIERIIGAYIREYGIRLVTNHGTYSPDSGLKMFPPAEGSPFYDPEVGISKAALVKKVKEEGYRVIFAGDGPPDIAPAAAADVVFAKRILLEECRKRHIRTCRFDGFEDIYAYLKEM